jgi:hypothetical protein
MLFLHETHEISGGKSAEADAALRDTWRPLIEADNRARVLWHWHLTHGTGASYQLVTITAVRDWQAWGQLVERMRGDGAWQKWFDACAAWRRELTSKLLLPAPWSPLQTVDLAAAPAPTEGGAVSLFLHDTGWPFPGKLDAYVDALGSVFYPQTRRSRMIRVEACWVTAPGTGRHHEVVLLQRILDWPAFSQLLTAGERQAQPGDWMIEGLRYRDRWESKLLRPAAWSPLQ